MTAAYTSQTTHTHILLAVVRTYSMSAQVHNLEGGAAVVGVNLNDGMKVLQLNDADGVCARGTKCAVLLLNSLSPSCVVCRCNSVLVCLSLYFVYCYRSRPAIRLYLAKGRSQGSLELPV